MPLLEDAEWRGWSDREIAVQCNVSHPFVASLRPHLETLPDTPTSRLATREPALWNQLVPFLQVTCAHANRHIDWRLQGVGFVGARHGARVYSPQKGKSAGYGR